MGMQLRKATRQQAKLRIGMSGPSGSGKTYSSLLLARGLVDDWNKIALIDTENGRADFYSDLGEYNILRLEAPFTPERYIEAINTCEEAGVEVIIIDSISHEWEGKGGCLEINEKIAQTKFKGNTWTAWSVTTPRHQAFIDSIVSSKAHIITTVRNKIDTVQSDDGNGKKIIKKVGIKEITREGFEYELTVNFSIDRDGHYITASKDNTGLFDSRDPFVITQATGEEILNWNLSGEKVKSIEEKQQANYSNLFEIFTHIESKENFDKEVKTFKENLVKDVTFISKSQLNEIGEIITNLKNSFEEKKENKETIK